LLEAVVFAGRIADSIKGMLPESALYEWAKTAGENDDLVTVEDSPELSRLRGLMSAHAGVIRDEAGLKLLIRELVGLERKRPRVRFSNIVGTAKLIAVGAYLRTESRGAHMRADHPTAQEALRHRTYLTLKDANRIAAELAG
jgi:L-aspartate oxidase